MEMMSAASPDNRDEEVAMTVEIKALNDDPVFKKIRGCFSHELECDFSFPVPNPDKVIKLRFLRKGAKDLERIKAGWPFSVKKEKPDSNDEHVVQLFCQGILNRPESELKTALKEAFDERRANPKNPLVEKIQACLTEVFGKSCSPRFYLPKPNKDWVIEVDFSEGDELEKVKTAWSFAVIKPKDNNPMKQDVIALDCRKMLGESSEDLQEKLKQALFVEELHKCMVRRFLPSLPLQAFSLSRHNHHKTIEIDFSSYPGLMGSVQKAWDFARIPVELAEKHTLAFSYEKLVEKGLDDLEKALQKAPLTKVTSQEKYKPTPTVTFNGAQAYKALKAINPSEVAAPATIKLYHYYDDVGSRRRHHLLIRQDIRNVNNNQRAMEWLNKIRDGFCPYIAEKTGNDTIVLPKVEHDEDLYVYRLSFDHLLVTAEQVEGYLQSLVQENNELKIAHAGMCHSPKHAVNVTSRLEAANKRATGRRGNG